MPESQSDQTKSSTNFKPLKMVLCPSCDGVPLKFKRKTGRPPVYQHRLFEHSIDPSQNLPDTTFKRSTLQFHFLYQDEQNKTFIYQNCSYLYSNIIIYIYIYIYIYMYIYIYIYIYLLFICILFLYIFTDITCQCRCMY